MRTQPGGGCGSGSVDNTRFSGPPGRLSTTARMVRGRVGFREALTGQQQTVLRQ
jgi:hypothetical protein